MNIWKMLKTDKCKDKNQIKAAYHELLIVTNPEDFPEEFKALRQAYEEALRYADEPEENEKAEAAPDTSPEGLFMERVKKAYQHFPDRLNPEKWEELLDEDICFALDTKLEIRNRLLTFFMSSYRLPREVWQLLDRAFHLKESKEELYELFPRDFIDHAVIYGIDNDLSIDLTLFEGADEAAYDQFISCYINAVQAIDARDLDGAKALIEEMQELNIYHPYLDIVRIRILLLEQLFDQARSLAEQLYNQYPYVLAARLYMGETAFYLGNIDEAEGYYNQVAETEPDNFLAIYGIACCLEKKDKLEESKAALLDILTIYPNSLNVNGHFEHINQKLTTKYEKKWAEDHTDAKAAYELAWCYIQSGKIQEGLELLPQFTPRHPDRFGYLNLCGRLYLADEQFEKALDYFKKWEAATVGLTEDGSEEVRKELGRRELPIHLQSSALLGLDRKEEALECVNRSLAIKEETGALYQKALTLYRMKRYEETLAVCDHVQQLSPSFWHQYLLRGKCLYDMGQFQDAFDCFNATLDYYHYSLDAHIYKIRILINHKQYEQSEEIVTYLEEQGVESDRIQVCRGQLLYAKEDDDSKDTARKIYQEVINKIEAKESDMDWVHQIYYLMAVALENSAATSEIISYIDRGLAEKPDDVSLLDYKAYTLKEYNRQEEAMTCYKQILEINSSHYRANDCLGHYYFEREEYAAALPYFEKLNGINRCAYNCTMVGRIMLKSGRFESARELFNSAIELDPQVAENYHFAAVCCKYLNQYERAIEYGQQTVKAMMEADNPFENAYRLMSQNYMRLGKKAEALEVLNKNRELFGEEESLEIMRMYMMHGDYRNGLAVLELWYQNSKNEDKQGIYNIEWLCLHFYMKEWKKGFKALKRFRNSNITQIILLWWGYYMIQQKPRKAIQAARKFINAAPDSDFGYYLLAKAAFYLGDREQARNNAEKSLAILENRAENFERKAYLACQRAKCKVILQDQAGMFQDIETAAASHQCSDCYCRDCYEIHEVLAFYYETVGDTGRALHEYETALGMEKYRFLLVLEAEALKKRMGR
ncbi:MAG: tetratricopeptide repeat protein [Lachnospiraceae bacterium]